MQEVLLSVKDYLTDCWHDWLLSRLQATYPNATIYIYDHGYDADFIICHWKEGNLWHYIRQRRIAKKTKALKEAK